MAEAAAAASTASAAKENKKPKVELTSPQKAAAVIVALGADKASLLYKYMEPEDVEMLTLEVARLGFLDSEQTEEVLNEFYQVCLTNKAVTEGGLEYARTVLEKAYGEQAASDLLSKVTKSLKNRDFGAVLCGRGQGGGRGVSAGRTETDSGGGEHRQDRQRIAYGDQDRPGRDAA